MRTLFKLSLVVILVLFPLVMVQLVSATNGVTYIFQLSWGSEGTGNGQFNRPYGVAVDSNGNVYVADYGNHRIEKFDSGGGFLTKWGNYGTGDGQFTCPEGVAADSGGNVYVADNYNHRIQKLPRVLVIPEFPSFLITPLFMIATLLAVIIYRRKRLHPLKS